MSIFSLSNATLILANKHILDKSDFQIQPKERIALVGRNGAGKSTFLKLMQGELQLDAGQMQQLSGIRIRGLAQDVPDKISGSVYQFLEQSLDKEHDWESMPKIETMASRLGVDTSAQLSDLSGGMKRRVLLCAALIAAPDLLLLDEPTNHLDIDAIEWLESYLNQFSGAVVVVTHDREFLARIAKRIVEIDRGSLHSFACDYESYLDRREAMRVSEQRQEQLFDKKLAEEEGWIRTGIKARRTRNEGRVRALKALREQYKARHKQLGSVKSMTMDVARSGTVVIEAKNLHYEIDHKTLVRDLSILITRGDKLGIIGPNGCGKTTLVRLLLEEIKPTSGSIRHGTSVNVAYFDQLRRQLQEDKTVLFNVAEGADYVSINGKQKHVASYLSDFLFQSDRFNQPVSSLSGGEKNRLMLAKLLAKPVNLLVMDEPTNDLDIETLELLENMLVEYSGTLILISHDRAFINQVVTSILVYEQEGDFQEFVGSYDDYKVHKKQLKEQAVVKNTSIKRSASTDKLNYKEQRELVQLPEAIEKIEQTISEQQALMADPQFYQQDPQDIAKIHQQLSENDALLVQMYARWEELAARE